MAFHRALLDEVVNGDHHRLGDAILAGQAGYADTGAFPELLEKAGGGLLFPPGDVRGLADRLLELHADPARRQDLGRRGSEGARRHYSAARMAERTLEICAEAQAAFAGA